MHVELLIGRREVGELQRVGEMRELLEQLTRHAEKILAAPGRGDVEQPLLHRKHLLVEIVTGRDQFLRRGIVADEGFELANLRAVPLRRG